MTRKCHCAHALLIISSILLITGACLAISWPYIFQSILNKFLTLKPNSKSYDIWKETPVPLYLDLYLFNLTNAKAFQQNPKIKPEFEEIGPFIFCEVHKRVDVIWHSNNTVSYNQTREWHFVPESFNLDANITNLDIIALAIAHSTKDLNVELRLIVDALLKLESKLLVTKPAKDWLFDGMDLPILKILNNKLIKPFVHNLIPYDKFGFFYMRNMSASYDGRFNMYTGETNLNQMGVLNTWNYVNKTTFYDETCALVNGSSGELLPPVPSQNKKLTLFITDICSSLTLPLSGKNIIEGVTGNEYVADNKTFSNLGENGCFCDGECPPEGIRNASRCRFGAPISVSLPHFYLSDPKLVTSVKGLKPNATRHRFSVTFDPITGIPLEVNARLQINVLLDNYKMFSMYKNTPKLYFPVLWFTQRVRITPDLAKQASLLSNVLESYVPILFILLAVLSLFTLSIVFLQWYWRRPKMDDLEILIPPQQDEQSDVTNHIDNN